MEANKILQSDILDLVFEGRNKEYGAYELRKKYNKRILMALSAILIVVVGVFLYSLFLSKLFAASDDEALLEKREITIQNLPPEEEAPPPPPPPPPPETPPPPPIETAKFIENIKPVETPPAEPPPVQDQLIEAQIGDENIKGQVITGPPPPPPVDEGKGVVAPPPPEDENKIFEKVEIDATVNMAQWRRHLENQLTRYIEDAASSGMAPGNYTVNVRFLVERDGSIAQVKALNDAGYGLSAGAVEVVKRGPKWSPGEQNGKKVRSYHTQPITFQIQEQ